MARVRRPKTKTAICDHCKRRRQSKYIEWHPGIDQWQCSNFYDCDAAIVVKEHKELKTTYVDIDYTNWLGKRRKRKIKPIEIDFTSTKFHPTTQWLLKAIDLESGTIKEFSMGGIHSWRKAS
jgi:hypothetical protein